MLTDLVRTRAGARVRALAPTIAVVTVLMLPSIAHGQKKHESIVQIEVRDSIGLPLPDAKVEVFSLLEGGVFWEWAPLGTSSLPVGINLLRFSFPGFRPTMFSVPVREGSTLSLRVNLDPEHDTTASSKRALEARAVRAVGQAVEGRARTDIIGRRKIIADSVFEKESVSRFGQLLHRMRNTELKVLPGSGGVFRVFAQTSGSSVGCPVQVMVNGDRRRILPFDSFDQLFSVNDVEAIEIFPLGSSIPLAYQVTRATCGLLVVWFRS